MRGRRQVEEVEDLVGQAGWMYADQFLALMVIFLATISFVPIFGQSDTNQNQANIYNYTEIYDKTLNLIYDSYDALAVTNDIKDFLKTLNYAPESEIIYSQIVGGFDPEQETSQMGIKRALVFSQKLDRGNPDLLKNASTTLSVSSSIKSEQIVIRFSFAARIGVKD